MAHIVSCVSGVFGAAAWALTRNDRLDVHEMIATATMMKDRVRDL